MNNDERLLRAQLEFQKGEESNKLAFEFFKVIATLSLGSIAFIIGLVGIAFEIIGVTGLTLVSIASLIFSAGLALFTMAQLVWGRVDETQSKSAVGVLAVSAGATVTFFFIGLVCFLVFAYNNFT